MSALGYFHPDGRPICSLCVAQRTIESASAIARSGLLQHHISQLENGVGMPTLATILKLAAAIGCKPTDLLSVFNAMDLRALLEK